MNELGKTIRILRNAKSMNMTDLANKSLCGVPYISLIESGNRQPSIEVLKRIAESLNIPAAVLILASAHTNSLTCNDAYTNKIIETIHQHIAMESQLAHLLESSLVAQS